MIKFKLSFLLVYLLINSTIIYGQSETKKIESLIDSFLKIVEKNPDSAYTYIEKATILSQRKKDEFLLSRCVYNKGYYHYLLKDFSTAEPFFYKAITIAKKANNQKIITLSYNQLGRIDLERGNYNSSLKKLLYALSIAEKNQLTKNQSYILINLGNLYENQTDTLKTIEYYQKGVEADQQNPDAWLGLAICFNHLKEHQKAYVAINTALNLDSEDVDLYYAKSEIEESLGDIESAVESMRIAMELDGDDIELKLDYLEMLRRNFELIEVLKTVEFFLEEHKNEKLLYFKVAVLLEMNKFATAYHLFERALANDYDNHTLLFSFFNEAKNDQNILELIDLYKKS